MTSQTSAPPSARLAAWASPPWASGDGGDDRQAEAAAAVAVARGGAAEALEGAVEELRREALAPSVTWISTDRRPRAAPTARSSRRRSGARCRPCCRPPGRAAAGRRAARARRRRRTSIRRPASSAAAGEAALDRLEGRRRGRSRSSRSGSSPRSVWAIVSRSSESWVRRSVSSAAEASAARSSSGERPCGQGQLELGAEDRQRRAQLVAGVGDEGALVLQRVAEPVEHLVQRLPEPRDLVAGGGDRQALVRRGGRDLRGPRAHRLDRAQRRGGDPVAGDRGEEQRRPAPPISSSCARSVSDSSRASVEVPTTTIRLPAARRRPGPPAGATRPSRPGSGPRSTKIGPRSARRSSAGVEQDGAADRQRGVDDPAAGVEHLGEALGAADQAAGAARAGPSRPPGPAAASSSARERRPESIVVSSSLREAQVDEDAGRRRAPAAITAAKTRVRRRRIERRLSGRRPSAVGSRRRARSRSI